MYRQSAAPEQLERGGGWAGQLSLGLRPGLLSLGRVPLTGGEGVASGPEMGLGGRAGCSGRHGVWKKGQGRDASRHLTQAIGDDGKRISFSPLPSLSLPSPPLPFSPLPSFPLLSSLFSLHLELNAGTSH